MHVLHAGGGSCTGLFRVKEVVFPCPGVKPPLSTLHSRPDPAPTILLAQNQEVSYQQKERGIRSSCAQLPPILPSSSFILPSSLPRNSYIPPPPIAIPPTACPNHYHFIPLDGVYSTLCQCAWPLLASLHLLAEVMFCQGSGGQDWAIKAVPWYISKWK